MKKRKKTGTPPVQHGPRFCLIESSYHSPYHSDFRCIFTNSVVIFIFVLLTLYVFFAIFWCTYFMNVAMKLTPPSIAIS